MKIKLDENLPVAVATLLEDIGHDVHTVNGERLGGHPDEEIWHAAQKESRFLITQDLDFSNARHFAAGPNHGVLLIRLRSPSWRSLTDRIVNLFQTENIAEWVGCIVIATERKIRVRKSGTAPK